MKNTKKVFLINPPDLVSRLCADILPEENYCESLNVEDGDTPGPVNEGWEMTLLQLREIYQKASANRFSVDFKVAAHRRDEGTLRFLRDSEWLKHVAERKKQRRTLQPRLQKHFVQDEFGF